MENESAFMVHHVMNKSKNIDKKKKRKRPNKAKPSLQIVQNVKKLKNENLLFNNSKLPSIVMQKKPNSEKSQTVFKNSTKKKHVKKLKSENLQFNKKLRPAVMQTKSNSEKSQTVFKNSAKKEHVKKLKSENLCFNNKKLPPAIMQTKSNSEKSRIAFINSAKKNHQKQRRKLLTHLPEYLNVDVKSTVVEITPTFEENQNGLENSIENSSFEKHFVNKNLFKWMISPIDVEEFMKYYWEKKHLYICKCNSEFSLLLNTPMIEAVLNSANIQYTKNVDITLYSNGVKELHNLEGRARSHVVWDLYSYGCSVRLLNPQTFVPNIHKLNSELQEFFGCFVGCNAYLTPPHSQGFAPHYDDIEAFILQIEGKKRWKIYEPKTPDEVLPRFSSRDFTDNELGDPIQEIVLSEGDVLYLPRGYIHQASTEQDFHSLHITVSAYQCNAWVDLLQKAIPKAIENAWKNDVEFRKGLPLDYLQAAGLARNRKYKRTRVLLQHTIKSMVCKLVDHIQIDSAVDQMASDFIYDALPPVLTEEEKQCSVYRGGLRMLKNGVIHGAAEFEFKEDTEIVLLRKFVCRLVKKVVENPGKRKKKAFCLYYTTDNSLEYHGEQPSFVWISQNLVPCVKYLFNAYPQYVLVKELPYYDDIDVKINFITDLWERGIIRTKTSILTI